MKKPRNSKHLADASSSSEIVGIVGLADNFLDSVNDEQRELEVLRSHNVAQAQTIEILMKQLEDKTNQITHLQEMLAKAVPVIGEAKPLVLTDEEIIAEFQLKALKAAAMTRDLTLDEVKRYDLLVKNKRLAQGNATTIDGSTKKLPANLSVGELMQIASNKTKE